MTASRTHRRRRSLAASQESDAAPHCRVAARFGRAPRPAPRRPRRLIAHRRLRAAAFAFRSRKKSAAPTAWAGSVPWPFTSSSARLVRLPSLLPRATDQSRFVPGRHRHQMQHHAAGCRHIGGDEGGGFLRLTKFSSETRLLKRRAGAFAPLASRHVARGRSRGPIPPPGISVRGKRKRSGWNDFARSIPAKCDDPAQMVDLDAAACPQVGYGNFAAMTTPCHSGVESRSSPFAVRSLDFFLDR